MKVFSVFMIRCWRYTLVHKIIRRIIANMSILLSGLPTMDVLFPQAKAYFGFMQASPETTPEKFEQMCKKLYKFNY
jgi:hypothetical protein